MRACACVRASARVRMPLCRHAQLDLRVCLYARRLPAKKVLNHNWSRGSLRRFQPQLVKMKIQKENRRKAICREAPAPSGQGGSSLVSAWLAASRLIHPHPPRRPQPRRLAALSIIILAAILAALSIIILAALSIIINALQLLPQGILRARPRRSPIGPHADEHMLHRGIIVLEAIGQNV